MKVCRVLASAGAARADVLSQRINGGFTLLHLAAGAGAAATVQWLLERTAAKSLNDGENEEGLTPLHCCVLGGNLNYATVDMLVTCGANVADMCALLHLYTLAMYCLVLVYVCVPVLRCVLHR